MTPVVLRGYGGAARQQNRVRAVGAGYVRLYCLNPPLNEIILLGPEGFKRTGGAGGWDTTDRPRAVGMTLWKGVPPLEGTLQILLDGQQQFTVEGILADIWDVARGTERAEPGLLFIDGIPALPADRWVITNIDEGDLMRRNDMHRVRQMVVLTLTEYVPPEYDTLRRGALSKARDKTVRYKVKQHDTPAKIARNRRCKWTDLKKVNAKGVITKANQHLKAGMTINVPMKKPAKKPKHKK